MQEQLRSFVQQTLCEWKLLISDDGSCDDTGEILRNFCASDSRADMLPPRVGAPGASANFEYLLANAAPHLASGEHVFLSDQDDIWEENKLEQQSRLLATASGCFSDATLIDESGALLSGSFLDNIRAPSMVDTQGLLAQNSVLGCALALRSEVLELALPFPPDLENHDWWLALCALVLDGLRCAETPLLRYRQHGWNVVGSYRPARQWRRLPALVARQRRVLRSQRAAVQVLIERLSNSGADVPRSLVDYQNVLHGSARVRCSAMWRGPFAAQHRSLRWLRAFAAAAL